jgi:hypothetical protein
MPAGIEQHPNVPGTIAHDDDRFAVHPRQEEITGLAQLTGVPYEQPRPFEHPRKLELEGVRVAEIRRSMRPLCACALT